METPSAVSDPFHKKLSTMQYLLVISPILLTLVSSQTNRRFAFWQSKDELSECIESRIPGFSKNYYDKHTRLRKAIADRVAEKLVLKITMEESMKIRVPLYTYKLRTDPRFARFRDDQEFWKKIDLVIQAALLHCSKPFKDPKISHNVLLLPNFPNETYELANALNFVLVNWPVPLHEIVRTQVGRATLRRYAENARSAFDRALAQFGDRLRSNFRSFWSLRAQRFYDGIGDGPAYIPHCFVMPFGFPHTYYRIRGFLRSGPLADRDPPTSRENRERVLNIHVTDRPGDEEFDIYSYYEEHSMTGSDYYLEIHRDQFYRVIFFVEELEASGIRTDEEDTYYGPLPYDIMPQRFQSILYNDEAYGDYLLERRNLEVRMGDPEDPVVQRLNTTARVREEDLMSLRNRHPLRSYNVSITPFIERTCVKNTTINDTTTTTTSTTTTTTTSTEMPQDSNVVKKGFLKSYFGKCLEKNDDGPDDFYELSDKTKLCKQDSCLWDALNPRQNMDEKTSDTTDGHTEDSCDVTQYSLLVDESFILINTLMNFAGCHVY